MADLRDTWSKFLLFNIINLAAWVAITLAFAFTLAFGNTMAQSVDSMIENNTFSAYDFYQSMLQQMGMFTYIWMLEPVIVLLGSYYNFIVKNKSSQDISWLTGW